MMVVADDLRLSVLQYAIEGKLSKQLKEDTPVEVTLEKLSSIKKHLIQTNAIKKEKPYTGDGTLPFDIPATWRWVRLFDIGELSRGKSKHRPRNDDALYINGTIPLIQTGDVAAAKKYIKSYGKCYNETGLAQSRLWKAGTLCITIAANIGDVAIMGFDACFPDSVVGFQPFSEDVSTEYIYYMLLAYKQRMNAKATKVAQSNLSLDKINTMLFPFPPVEEQQRISNRLNDLMVQIDEYEKIEKQLTSLKSAFPVSMKVAILQAAMQGKITKRLDTDSSVKELLERISAEMGNTSNRWAKKKPNLSDELFEIPDNWIWVTLPMVAQSELGKTLNKATDKGVEKPYLCSINVYNSGINLDSVKTALFSEHDIEKYRLKANDLLICEGGDAGRSCVWNSEQEMYYQNALHRVRFYANVNPYFFSYLMLLYKSNGVIASHLKGETIMHLVQNELNTIPFPLPPVEEQQRIVERLDNLLPLCDELVE